LAELTLWFRRFHNVNPAKSAHTEDVNLYGRGSVRDDWPGSRT
jgi:hypothetical protein